MQFHVDFSCSVMTTGSRSYRSKYIIPSKWRQQTPVFSLFWSQQRYISNSRDLKSPEQTSDMGIINHSCWKLCFFFFLSACWISINLISRSNRLPIKFKVDNKSAPILAKALKWSLKGFDKCSNIVGEKTKSTKIINPPWSSYVPS